MKTYFVNVLRRFAIAFLVLFMGNSSLSFAADVRAPSACAPFIIPLAGVPCGPGYTGTAFPLRIKACPSGVITDGNSFDRANCKPNGVVLDPNATNCSVTPTVVGCIQPPTAHGCSAGNHWTLDGSKIAHCVADDPNCPWGTTLKHDGLGNPTCVANTGPSNQVLQADGISCGCEASLVWNGGACVVPIVCPAQTVVATACQSGYTGNIVTTTTYSGFNCTAATYVDSSHCVIARPPTVNVCANGATNYPTCSLPRPPHYWCLGHMYAVTDYIEGYDKLFNYGDHVLDDGSVANVEFKSAGNINTGSWEYFTDSDGNYFNCGGSNGN